jgi:hypothetical protein
MDWLEKEILKDKWDIKDCKKCKELASSIREEIGKFSPKTHKGISSYDIGYNRALADYDKAIGIKEKQYGTDCGYY